MLTDGFGCPQEVRNLSRGGPHHPDGAVAQDRGRRHRVEQRDDDPGPDGQDRVEDHPLTGYLGKCFIELPLWDEMAGAIATDPSLVTKSVDAYVDVDTADGVDYGRAHVRPASIAPKDTGVRLVTIVQAIDTDRFLDAFVRAAQFTPSP